MTKRYDMIVIGAGSGGLSMALGLHQLGLKVLLIDKSDHDIGGECLNNGCIPSKAFIHISKMIYQATEARQFGISADGQVSIKKIWDYVRERQQQIRNHENTTFFRELGIDVVLGTARFTGRQQVEVNGQVYIGKKITVASGSKPRKLKVPGVETVPYFDNENIWQLEELPSQMLFIGAGPINMELGQAFARLGSQVTVVEMTNRILTKEPKEVSDILYQKSVALGIRFYMNTEVSHFTSSTSAVLTSTGQTTTANFEVVVVGIGRDINCSGLNPEAAGVNLDEKGRLVLDKYQRTSNKNILAIGDVAGGPQFSHGAEHQATILISNLFSPFKKKVSYNKFSWVTFTYPEVASFGLTEMQLKSGGVSYQKLDLNFNEDDRAITDNYQYGKLILYVSRSFMPFGKQKLLGGSLIAPMAGEMIQELTLAQSSGLGIHALFNKVHAYPTGSRVNKTIILNKYTEAIRPWMLKILKLLY